MECNTVFRERNVSAAVVEQGYAQFLFQPADALGQRRLCDVQLLCGTCHMLVLCHRIEIFQLQKFHAYFRTVSQLVPAPASFCSFTAHQPDASRRSRTAKS